MSTTLVGKRKVVLDALAAATSDDEEEDDEEDGEEEQESGTSSSFSLQECIDEFRARRIRRISTHSRDMPPPKEEPAKAGLDAELINQNRCNKEQERKCKPCKNGACYCFTSDSGDCASVAPPRETHVRQHRRHSRRSESSSKTVGQRPLQWQQPANNLDAQQQQENRRQSAPANIQLTTSRGTMANGSPLTAVSSLRAAEEDAPLIHIIQELRDNCVISEVRVNRQKLQGQQSPTKPQPVAKQPRQCLAYKPTAPALSNISEQETPSEQEEELEQPEIDLNINLGGSMHSTRRSSRQSSRRSSENGGRLLQKRLSHGQVNFKTRDSRQPPPKPPRRGSQSLDGKVSLSSLTSTTPSVREAERVLDEFLRQRGVPVPVAKSQIETKTKSKRKSYPLAGTEKPKSNPLPSCPSLSDIERVVASKRGSHYAKNMNIAKQAIADKPMKEIMLGWTSPKINDMLNYDAGRDIQQFKTNAAQAAPQSSGVAIGWQVPHKISLDTVDGALRENLASNMEQKQTPIKYPRGQKPSASQKFIWGEQWRQLSPWNVKANHRRGNQGSAAKSGLRNKSKNFLNNSKQKILRFVSPKKSNQMEQPRLCTVGVQTSQLDLDLHSQSPPGSYHSPVQSLSQSTASQTTPRTNSTQRPTQLHFDFERKVKPPTPPRALTPPKKQPRQRKLEFHGDALPTSYRSYHKELDQDASINKMGYLLSSIRAKLEASDEHALRTFRECSRFAPLERSETPSFDCPDSGRIAERSVTSRRRRQLDSEPIYSEIEEDCMHFSGSPQFESRTAAQVLIATPTATPTVTPTPTPTSTVSTVLPAADLNALYAQVQKPIKSPIPPQATAVVAPTPLGKFLQDSLRNGSFFQFNPLPDEPGSESSYTLATLPAASQSNEASVATLLNTPPLPPPLPPPLHQSLNNIHEQHSPPKRNRNLSKSELSLQRSEIFLENLCRSEIVLDHDHAQDNVRLEKVENTSSLRASSLAVDDGVSYDLPEECQLDPLYAAYTLEDDDSSYATHQGIGEAQSNYGSGQMEAIEPPPSQNQSTPKRQGQPRFTTKPGSQLSIDITDGPRPHNLSSSCPSTPHQPILQSSPAAHSLGELNQTPRESQVLSVSALARCRLLKDALRRSYRKGKDFFRAEKQRLTLSLNLNRSADQSNQTEAELDGSTGGYANLQLDSLMNESMSTSEQLAQAVSICRQLPELEISAEMVEAERLLLFQSLRQQARLVSQAALAAQRQAQCFLIDAMQLPVKADVNQDMFFNYYYICTFECEGRICSTQSVECQNGAALFRDCGIEFYSGGEAESLELRCQIFMLRLRKVSTLALEPNKAVMQQRGSSSLSGSSSSSLEQIVSRFRLHASFTLRPCQLVPYELVASETQSNPSKLCLRNSRSWQLPLQTHTKSTNLVPQITLTGRSELRLPKSRHAGYLNVQDARNQHNWNRRWCTLVGLQLSVWQHEANLTEEPPLLCLALQRCRQSAPLDVAPRELCARARSFRLACGSSEFYFAADTQQDLTVWLLQLNEALSLAARWLPRDVGQ